MNTSKEDAQLARWTTNYDLLERFVKTGDTEILLGAIDNRKIGEELLELIIETCKVPEVVEKAKEKLQDLRKKGAISIRTTLSWIEKTDNLEVIEYLLDDERILVKRALNAKIDKLYKEGKISSSYMKKLKMYLRLKN